jgi:hypothetical protein
LSMLNVWRKSSLILGVRHLFPSKLNFSGKIEPKSLDLVLKLEKMVKLTT